jgi:hypothetical protein
MANIGHFDATQVAPREDFSPIPTGEYNAQVIESDLKPTKKNDGHYAELTFEVIDGPYKGRRVWARLNLDNPNPKAVEIAQRELSGICHAVGKMQIKDTAELHYKPMVIRVEYVVADGIKQKNDGNEIKAYKALEGGAVHSGAGPAASANAAPPAATPPWQRSAA